MYGEVTIQLQGPLTGYNRLVVMNYNNSHLIRKERMGGPLLPKVGMRRIYAYYDSMIYSTFKVASIGGPLLYNGFFSFIYLFIFLRVLYKGFNSAELPLLDFYFYFFYIASFIWLEIYYPRFTTGYMVIFKIKNNGIYII